MYPLAVIAEMERRQPKMFASVPTGGAGLFARDIPTDSSAPFEFEDAMLGLEADCPAVGEYLGFLRRMAARFRGIKDGMGYMNPDASHSKGHDRWSIGWAGDELLPLANYLYVLKSAGVTGQVLECGAFKGSSTACLSWACHELGLVLFCADSFEGLPSGEGHYGKGDFKGSLDEVMENVRRFGRIECVRFIQGWYSESLRGFSEELSLIWMDVDLQQSVVDVLDHVFSRLNGDGVIFSDGFSVGVDFDGYRVRCTGGEPAGVHRFFEQIGRDHHATPCNASGLALILPNPRRQMGLKFFPERFRHLIEGIGA